MVFNLRHSVAEGSLGCFLARLALGGSFSGRLWLPLAHLARWGIVCRQFPWSQVTETIQNIQRGQSAQEAGTKHALRSKAAVFLLTRIGVRVALHSATSAAIRARFHEQARDFFPAAHQK